ncbi:MAG: restriction endonuclease subunit S [Halioglobus sp.]|nr:restriction endonuclease subunit S [Halioglobus sp.]
MQAGSKIPETWVLSQLGDTCQLINGDRGKNYPSKDKLTDSGFPFVNAGHIENGLISSDGMKFLSNERFDLLNSGKFVIGDILFCIRGSLGKVAINRNIESGAIASSLIIVRSYPYLLNYLVFHYLSSPLARKMIRKFDNGTAQPNLAGADLARFEFPLPPASEQSRIVAKIEALFSKLDNGVEALKTARKQLKVYRQTVLKHAFEGKLTARWRRENMDKLEPPERLLASIRKERQISYQQRLKDWQAEFEAWEKNGRTNKMTRMPKEPAAIQVVPEDEVADLPALPSNWTYMRFGDFIDSIDAGKSFKCDERRPAISEIGVAKVSALTWGEYNEEESKTCIDPEKVNGKYFINCGDFLLSRANTIELVGACVIAKRVTQKIMLSDKTLRLGFSCGIPQYFLHFLRSHLGRNEIMKRSTGNQESMRNIGQDRIRSIILPVCGDDEALELVSQVEAKLANIDAITSDIDGELKRSETLRQSILKKAFSGQLVPQDPSDEPADALLERILAVKAEQHEASNNKSKRSS